MYLGEVDYPKFKALADAFANNSVSIAIEGGAGLGKTSMIEAYARERGLPCITVAVGVWSDPASIVEFGFGVSTDEGGRVKGIVSEDKIPAWAPCYRIDAKTGAKVKTDKTTMGYKVWTDAYGSPEFHPAIVFFDEFSAPRAELQNAILTLALTKKLKNWTLDKGTRFFVAYNSAKRIEFAPFVHKISPALVGNNGRFVELKVKYNPETIIEYVLKDAGITDFWKGFTEKNLRVLDIYNEEKGRKVSPRSYCEMLKALSTGKYDNVNFNAVAETICFALTGEQNSQVLDAFIERVKTYTTFNGEDILSGKVMPDTQIDANCAVKELCNVFMNRIAKKVTLMSAKERKCFETFVKKTYVTGTKDADGADIVSSKKEFLEVIKANLIESDIMHRTEFAFIAGLKDESERKNNEESFEF